MPSWRNNRPLHEYPIRGKRLTGEKSEEREKNLRERSPGDREDVADGGRQQESRGAGRPSKAFSLGGNNDVVLGEGGGKIERKVKEEGNRKMFVKEKRKTRESRCCTVISRFREGSNE